MQRVRGDHSLRTTSGTELQFGNEQNNVQMQTTFSIIPTFDSTITSSPNSTTIQATINSVIAKYNAVFKDPVTVSINFVSINTGLGQSTWSYYTIPYASFVSFITARSATVYDSIAVPTIPVQSTEPLLGHSTIVTKTALYRALNTSYTSAPQYDGTISVNMSICNLDRNTIDHSKYDLSSVIAHEIDEVMGLGSGLDGLANISAEDMFRYNGSGVRSYTSSTSATSYFSLNGTLNLIQFNQSGGGSDYGDWLGGSPTHVQDAYGTPGAINDPNVEFIALDAIGWTYMPNFTFATTGSSSSNMLSSSSPTTTGVGTASGICSTNILSSNITTTIGSSGGNSNALSKAGSISSSNGISTVIGSTLNIINSTGTSFSISITNGFSGNFYSCNSDSTANCIGLSLNNSDYTSLGDSAALSIGSILINSDALSSGDSTTDIIGETSIIGVFSSDGDSLTNTIAGFLFSSNGTSTVTGIAIITNESNYNTNGISSSYGQCGSMFSITGSSDISYQIIQYIATSDGTSQGNFISNYEFDLRGIAYIKDAALKGILKKIAIKKINLSSYQDTLNEIWNKDNVINYQKAISLIAEFKQIESGVIVQSSNGSIALFLPTLTIQSTCNQAKPLLYFNEIRYVKAKALVGKYQKVCVRNTRNALLEDTFKVLWNNQDLLSHDKAVQLVDQYLS